MTMPIRRGYTNPEPARAHVKQHLAHGTTLRGLAKQTGVHHVMLSRLAAGRHQHIADTTATRILAVPVPARKPAPPTNIGCLRRLDALAYLGWSLPNIAKRCGIGTQGLYKACQLRHFSTGMATAIATSYPTLARTRGPNRRVTTRALRAGKLPPWVWDGRNIDSPTAKPDLTIARQGPQPPTLARALTEPPMWSPAYYRAMTGCEPLRDVA